MVETLRKKAKKSNMLRVIFSVIGVVILLAVTKFAIFDVLTGPTKLDITQDPATYEGKYVTIDAEYFLYDYIEHTTTTTRKYGGSTTNTNGYSYLVFQSVDDYEKEASIWYFYSIYLDKSRQKEMEGKIQQTFDYFKQIQNRITGFVCAHCKIPKPRLEELMMETGMLTKDVGTVLVGREAVEEGIICEVGGISDAIRKLHDMVGKEKAATK